MAGLTILDARISTTRDGLAIDTLHVACSDAPGPLEPARAERVRDSIAQVLAGELMVSDRLEKAPAAARH